MLARLRLGPWGPSGTTSLLACQRLSARAVHLDHRVRLRNSYVPLGAVTDKNHKAEEDGHSKLIRAGFLRQAHAGIFHLLPMGFRVQEKIKRLIDKHMQSIGASRVSLSAISSPSLWRKSGRYDKIGSELFQLLDRKDTPYLLSPTHEEEITSLVRQTVVSYKSLPLRVYQITRKYRDEFRPRKGLLRSREFMMKDLYTFDVSVKSALATYNEVRAAYDKLFSELRLPVLVAEASSGDMGGDLSHEYHLAISQGEDDVIKCDGCGYTANSEVAETSLPISQDPEIAKPASADVKVWRGISKDRFTLVNVWYSGPARDTECVNIHAVKRLVPNIDTSIENATDSWWTALRPPNEAEGGLTDSYTDSRPSLRFVNLVDGSVAHLSIRALAKEELAPTVLPFRKEVAAELNVPLPEFISFDRHGERLHLLAIQDGDPCPKCDSGALKVTQAIELGHTFHLGDRYSEPMGASINVPSSKIDQDEQAIAPGSVAESTTRGSGEQEVKVHMQMGCHGIGVSRIMGAVADHLADDRGLNWPRTIAPYEVAVLSHKNLDEEAVQVYDMLVRGDSVRDAASPQMAPLDLLLDDRDRSLPWKLKDADLMGYPVIVVVGNEWEKTRRCEVQCRQLGVQEFVSVDDLYSRVNELLGKL
ncbi:hypothetical protein RB595_001047 [Gaeumannomyces hyphopodioides]